MIEIQLTDDGAESCGITVKPRGMSGPIGPLARKLVESGRDEAETVNVYRSGTICFEPMALGVWAGITARESIAQPVKFHKYVQFEGVPDTGAE